MTYLRTWITASVWILFICFWGYITSNREHRKHLIIQTSLVAIALCTVIIFVKFIFTDMM